MGRAVYYLVVERSLGVVGLEAGRCCRPRSEMTRASLRVGRGLRGRAG